MPFHCLATQRWRLSTLLITIVVLCLYIIGDGLRDAFDPTAQE